MNSIDMSRGTASSFQTQATTRGGAATPNSDYMTFLTMLTAQMRNQDPLNPMQASDFAVQLATFAGVEQQSRTNDLLANLVGQGQLSEMSGMIGTEVALPGTAWFEGREIDLQTNPLANAEEVRLIVRNEAGLIVDQRSLTGDTTSYRWDGRASNGDVLPEGQYFFEVESWSDGAVVDSAPPEIYALVREVRREGSQIYLTLAGNLVVAADQVRSIRAAQSPEQISPSNTSTASTSRNAAVSASEPTDDIASPAVWRSNSAEGFNHER